ncbi:MAG: amidohydrolase family protein [Deltaproteobacteria bacterium]|nr:amidohydrolase family protein [Deltaproteobacteria bacterium]
MATLKMKYGVVSADDHIQEAPDVWTNRMSKAKFGDDIPHIVELPDGTETWSLGGNTKGFGGLARVSGVNPNVKRWEDVPPSTYRVSERLKILDQEELDASVLFPNIIGITNQNFQKEGSEAFRLACIQAYNDWLIDEWQDVTPRFVAQCVTPMWDVDLCVAEIRRAVKRGHKALVWHGAPHILGLKHFNDPYWYPVYETCCDLDVPICLHSTALPALPPWDSLEARARLALGVSMTFVSHMEIVSNVLYSGVFERFPRLKTISVESGVGWLPYLLEELDHEFEERHVAENTTLTRKPSDVFRTNMWSTFWHERHGIRSRDEIGVDKIMYSVDYPHGTTTFPKSIWCRTHSLQDVTSADERKQILMDNAIGLYKLDVDESGIHQPLYEPGPISVGPRPEAA